MRDYIKYVIVGILVILLDQASKLFVYRHVPLYGDISIVGNFIKITYVLNYGIAFGFTLGSKYGKVILTLSRMIIIVLIFFKIIQQYRISADRRPIWAWVLVWSGSIGNTIDSVFYGKFLDNAPRDALAKWFHGQVIDMINIHLFEFTYPAWVPYFGGYSVYCLPIFNIADTAIFAGVCLLLYHLRKERHCEYERAA